MSNNNLDNFRRQSAEEEFLRLAAIEIELEENNIFLEAQGLPDPDTEVLKDIQANLIETIRKNKKKQQIHKIILHMSRLTACAAALCCLLVSGVYFGVDAARLSINNFVMELFDGHAIIWTDDSEANTGAMLPEKWNGPFSVNWVPARFTNVQIKDLETSWRLAYSCESADDYLFIYVWSSKYAPNVSTEGMNQIAEENIQGSSASIYSDPSKEVCTLIWVNSDYVIQIGGTITSAEAKKMAENFDF